MNGNMVSVGQSNAVSMWETAEGVAQIKQLFAPKLNNSEFTMFVEMGKATGLNPFLREMWAVKYDEKAAAQIFIGRDGYRKSAQRHPLYDYHVADAVYSNDKFNVVNGEVSHVYDLKDRGTLVGAYCIVQRKGSSRPTYVFADLKEYTTNKSLWNPQTGKPATMIKKVAECQGLKSAFQELFAGTYSEAEEFSATTEVTTHTKPGKGVNGLKEKLGMIVEAETETETVDYNADTGEVVEAEVEIIEAESSQMSADTIIFLIESSDNNKELMDAMKHLKDLSPADKKAVYAKYKSKEAEFKK